jgi:putative membrane protein
MLWYDHGMSGWGWALMTISMVVFWALVIGLGVLLFRALSRGPERAGSIDSPSASTSRDHLPPEQLLAERYARGEIDDEEYRRRIETLHGLGRT